MKALVNLKGLALIVACSPALAGTMGPIQPEPSPWYLVGSAGYSNSRDANITVNPLIWDNAVQGYSDSLGSTAALAFGVGTYLTPALRIDARGERRGDYSYSRVQTGIDTGTPGFTGDSRVRRFKVLSEAVMVSGWLDIGQLSNHFLWQAGHFSIQPFVGAGIGANYMKVHDFHTIGAGFGTLGYRRVASINASSTGTKFAWHAAAGLSSQITERATLSIGYNYFDGGDLPFPNYIDSSTSSPDAPLGRNGVLLAAWKGKLRANEAFAELRVQI